MVITDKRISCPIKFGDLPIGECFYLASHAGNTELYLRIHEIQVNACEFDPMDQSIGIHNTLNLNDMKTLYVETDETVNWVESSLDVWSKAYHNRY